MIGSYFWQEGETFVEEGIRFEPFNLEQEREEGYFDDQGNFVEYIDNEIKVLYQLYLIFSPFLWNLFVIFRMINCRTRGLTALRLILNLLERDSQ